jgi:uncharacterized protein YbbC (DUF1343 family)/CubicO group peptidase (beta-lactamase class C family)
VVLVGHNGRVVFEHAYGDRKLADEPGLDGQPAPAEPMTEDTIFDMASLSKCLSTATAIMQLYEAGRITSFDDPVEHYLPSFNPPINGISDIARAKVTLRMLLTHTSGEAPDVNLKDPWGLAAPEKGEGIHRALTTPLKAAPGDHFEYSDINFILLGYIVEQLSGQSLDVYAEQHIFRPLGMTDTRYLPLAKVCGPHRVDGAAIAWAAAPRGHMKYACPSGDWSTSLLPRIAPEAHDDEAEADPTTNPDFDHLLRGTVHDPTTRRMGGVAGHAGVFSTAHDVSLYASALLEKLLYNTGPFPLKQSTLELMTTPQQPDHYANQLADANAAEQAAIAAGDKPAAPSLAPHYPAIKGQDIHALGWDIDTGFSKPRGLIFPVGSFGHTGFTGTSLWMDPGSDTYVILLANAIHPRGNGPISNLRGEVATAAAEALRLYGSERNSSDARQFPTTLAGIDVLEQERLSPLLKIARGPLGHEESVSYGLLTNQTGVDSKGLRTIDVLRGSSFLMESNVHLTKLFSPEHGIFGKQDSTHISAEMDPTSGLRVTSLYGPTDADKRPSHEALKNLDAVVIDLQDAGVRFYTYDTVVGYFLEAAAREKAEYHHELAIVVLDRPDLIGGAQVQGPVSDADLTTGSGSYIDFMPLPVRHGLTLGELARYIAGTKHLDVDLIVVPMQHWSRSEYFDETGLPWTNPSPNLRSLAAATLYPGLGFLDFSGVSVGRGTSSPFELFGAAWMHADEVAAKLNARHIPGVSFAPTSTEVAEDANHYPFHGETIGAVRITVTDRNALNSPELGIEILSALHRLYPAQFQVEKALRLIGSRATLDAIERGDDPRSIAASWSPALASYLEGRAPFLLYH